MVTKRALLVLAVPLLALATFATRVTADEHHGIAIQAPLDAIACAATPPTVTVLGLTIDVSTANIEVGHDSGGGDDLIAREHGDEGEGGDGGDGGSGTGGGGCATLTTGQIVRIKLTSDVAPLVATSIEGADDGSLVIAAPLQAIDATAMTITLLGLTIDVSGATIQGNDGDDGGQPVTLDQLMAGERAVVHLDPAMLPALVALALEVRNDFAVKLRAPLDAVDCAATPPTITVLGLTIDISTAVVEAGSQGGDDLVARQADEGGDGGDDQGGDDQGDDDGGGGDQGQGGCAALVVGQTVQVTIASDATPLVATKVEQDNDDGVQIKAPLQAVDAGAGTITLLGLTIDASMATAGGDDENDGENTPALPVDLTQLAAGQFADVRLDASMLPALVATEVEVFSAGGGLDVEVDDPSGNELNDPGAALTVDVLTKTRVRGGGGSHRSVVQMLHFRATAHGSFRLSGLPAGTAKITVAGVSQGVTLARTQNARTKGNEVRSLRVRLRRVRTPH
jgi:hypothetical protein